MIISKLENCPIFFKNIVEVFSLMVSLETYDKKYSDLLRLFRPECPMFSSALFLLCLSSISRITKKFFCEFYQIFTRIRRLCETKINQLRNHVTLIFDRLTLTTPSYIAHHVITASLTVCS